MGIFAENAWCLFKMINNDKNSLTAYYSSNSSWHIVITRQNYLLDGIPIETKIKKTETSWTYQTPDERYWNKDDNHFPYYAIYLVPWTTYDDGDGTNGMIRMKKNTLDKKMTRIHSIGNNYMKLHKFLSDFQYPFLNDIKNIKDIYFFFHKIKSKRMNLEEQIIKIALHPRRLNYYFEMGYGVDDWCNC
jgi:hypothetical protein